MTQIYIIYLLQLLNYTMILIYFQDDETTSDVTDFDIYERTGFSSQNMSVIDLNPNDASVV